MALAVVAAGGAAFMVRNIVASRDVEAVQVIQAPPPEIPKVMVLVAAQDMRMGHSVIGDWLAWKEWPEELVDRENYIIESERPDAVESLAGAVVRSEVISGEPIIERKFAKNGDRSMMSLIVRRGMRAVSLPITVETGAGGFILPGDRVDLLLTHRKDIASKDDGVSVDVEGQTRVVAFSDQFITKTILTNVRILAIDQSVAEIDGAPSVIGRTATVELTPDQAELVALAEKSGDLSLSLRSFADGLGPNGEPNDEAMPQVVMHSELLRDKTPAPVPPEARQISIVRAGVASVMKLESTPK